MFHYILEYCILLCYHSINTLIVPAVSCAFSTLHWLLAATAGTLMFLFVTLFLSYAVAFAIMVHNHGWPRPRFGLYNWFRFHYNHWKSSPMHYFLLNVWELFKFTHNLYLPFSVKCKSHEISFEMNTTVVKTHIDSESNYFSTVETSYVPEITALQTMTVFYTGDPQFNQPVLVREMPNKPRQDGQVATAPTSAPTTQNSAPTVPTTPNSVSTAPPTPTPTLQAPTAPTADPQPATPNPKKRTGTTGGRQGGAKRAKAGAR